MQIKTIEWNKGALRFIDQTKLPLEEIYIETDDIEVVADAIRTLKIRGAPAIGVAAAYGVIAAIKKASPGSFSELQELHQRCDTLLRSTRPTAVNLSWALNRIKAVIGQNTPGDAESIIRSMEIEASAIHREDIAMCEAIGRYGAEIVPETAAILTHCNAGALATSGIGTALAVITTAFQDGKKIKVYADETRPLLQGARLTVWELQKAGIDVTLITDNSAAYVMKKIGIDMVIVGADRIVANGDAANKIGTYNVALIARAHNIPFYVAAPSSTVDVSIPNGEMIPIEERSPEEITEGFGRRTAPLGTKVFAPAFDVTPNALITGIITEFGIIRPPFDGLLSRELSQELQKRK